MSLSKNRINSTNCCYRPQRSWAKVMFLHLSVILLTGGGVWSWGVVSKFLGGGLQIFGGGDGLQIFGGVSKFFWGVVSKFSGQGVVSKCLGGLQFFGGISNFLSWSPNFFLSFFNFFPQKNLSGMHPPPSPRDGQCTAGTHPTGMHSCYLLQAECDTWKTFSITNHNCHDEYSNRRKKTFKNTVLTIPIHIRDILTSVLINLI